MGDAVAEEIFVGDVGEEEDGRGYGGGGGRLWNAYCFYGFADFDELGGSGMGVAFDFATTCPVVGFVVVIDVAEEEAAVGFVDDEADVHVDADRPEVGVFGAIEFVQPHSWAGRVELDIECGGFDGFLFLVGEFAEAGREGVGDA